MTDGDRPPGPDRFPGFSSVAQAPHWDDATRELVLARLQPAKPMRLLAEQEQRAAVALVAQLVDVDEELAQALTASIDARLADGETDGWHYDDMPVDPDTWRRSLAALDDEAQDRHGRPFAALGRAEQHALLGTVKDGDGHDWRGLPRAHLWNFWMRYACTAYYAHPHAWDEMGWPGPAYPRGYKNIGVDALEPFEVPDADPRYDPVTKEEEA